MSQTFGAGGNPSPRSGFSMGESIRRAQTGRRKTEQCVIDHNLDKSSYGEPLSSSMPTLVRQGSTGPRSEVYPFVESRYNQTEAPTDSIASLMQSLREAFECITLPRAEPLYFDGDSSKYWNFIRYFEANVESSTQCPRKRLYQLINHCRGRAREAILGCNILDPEVGYLKAREILGRRFGKRHDIARSLIGNIQNGPAVKGNPEELEKYASELRSCLETLTQMRYVADLNAFSTLNSVLDRLPTAYRDRWARQAYKIQLEREPTFEDLVVFVEEEAQIASSSFAVHNSTKPFSKPKIASFVAESYDELSCPLCKLDHTLNQCQRLLKASVDKRLTMVRNSGCCFRCLSTGHRSSHCRSKRRCTVPNCGGAHHTLLHRQWQSNTSNNPPGVSVDNGKKENQPAVVNTTAAKEVALGVIAIQVKGKCGWVKANALLDNGSNITLMSSGLAKILSLEGEPCSLNIRGIHGEHEQQSFCTSAHIATHDLSKTMYLSRISIVEKLPDIYPSSQHKSLMKDVPHLRDVSVNYLNGRPIEMIIGVDYPKLHTVLETKLGIGHDAYAEKTFLGWVVRGPLTNDTGVKHRNCTVAATNNLTECDWRRIYDHDYADFDPEGLSLSVEDADALKQVRSSCSLYQGHFYIGLPWRKGLTSMPNNLSLAKDRLVSLTRRLNKDEKLRNMYSDGIKSMLSSGYAELVPVNDLSITERVWYLPHHPVFNPNKPNKVRIVHDCAASYRGYSLNKCLLQGPNPVNNLVGILLRFRENPVAVVADIKEMFMQVKVPIEDRNMLRFLWWEDGAWGSRLVHLRMTSHVFGAVSSPFTTHFALEETVRRFGNIVSDNTSEAIIKNFYVDDCVHSLATVNEAKTFVQQVVELLKLGGFQLHKFISNSKELLSILPSDMIAEGVMHFRDNELFTERALGITWHVGADDFRFQLGNKNEASTRRQILSEIASLYDPLGLVAPVLMGGKIILQDLCRERLAWDDIIPSCYQERWKSWKRQVALLNQIHIRRYLRDSSLDVAQSDLHMFCDASENGYGAVAYAKFTYVDASTSVSLIMSKARVRPIKNISVPRLELGAAVLATDIARIIIREMKQIWTHIYFWTDSTVVLHYLCNETTRFSTFVSNRIQRIKSTSKVEQWRYVPGNLNPADLSSRGMVINSKNVRRWFKPEFLTTADPLLLTQEVPTVKPDELELKRSSVVINVQSEFSPLAVLWNHYSHWMALLRAVAWLNRFKIYVMIHISRNNPQRFTLRLGRLSMEEIKNAERDVVRAIQAECFPRLISKLSGTRGYHAVEKQYRHLCPTLVEGVITVGGRSQIQNELGVQRPRALIPPNHPVTKLIIRHVHEMNGHVGATHVLSLIRQNFWILKGGTAVRCITNKCIPCRRRNARFASQIMAPLPMDRVEAGFFAFDKVGVDYFGPFWVRRARSLEPRYGCMFTCLKTRAVHIETATALSSDCFMLALTRFIARRGQPSHIFSDNGTNFHGAWREIANSLRNMSQDKIARFLQERSIDWTFGPPDASHWGGVWERMIRSTRNILVALAGKNTLSDEMLQTLLIEAERVINSRPLVALTDDINDLNALSPNDLLLVSNKVTFQDGMSSHVSTRQVYHKIRHLADEFWKRWKNEYLPTLAVRHKWQLKSRDLTLGELVLVRKLGSPRSEWPLGRITRVAQSQDGAVREVEVKTVKGTMRRDVRSLIPLEASS